MAKVYAVAVRTTRKGDDVFLFREKAQAKVFIHESLNRYVEAMIDEREVNPKFYLPVSEKIESFAKSKGESYDVWYGTCGGDYVSSARLLEKEVL